MVVIAALFAVLERDNITGSLVGLSVSYALQVMAFSLFTESVFFFFSFFFFKFFKVDA